MRKRLLASILAVTLMAGSFADIVPMSVQAAESKMDDAAVVEEGQMEFWNQFSEDGRSYDFDEGWLFHLGDEADAQKINYDDSGWEKVTLPHDWSIEQDFTGGVAAEIGHLPGGTGWYRKSFVLPEDFSGKSIRIDFGGVYMDSNVYVNGEFVGNYPYGYMPFSYDIMDYLVCDGKTENVIAVQANSPTDPGGHSGRWYSGSGIYRDVMLTVMNPVHVVQYGTVVTTPELETQYDTGNVSVQMKSTVQNAGTAAVSVRLRHSVLNYEDQTVFAAPAESDSVTLNPEEKQTITQTVNVVNPELWSPDTPNLYLVRTEVLVGEQVVDTYDTRFGFRWFIFDNEEGFSLNGEYMKLQGVCMHHDQGALGSAAYEAAIARQVRILKEMGVNAVRVTHNPAADVLLKQCDEQGLMVVEEAFDTWNEGKVSNDYHRFFDKLSTHPDAGSGVTWAQFDLQQMVRRGINNPSIIMWSMGNEVYESWYDRAVEVVKKLVKWTKEIDTTRPTTMGEDKMRDTNAENSVNAAYVKIAKEVDVVGINYGENNYDGYHAMYPEWCIYGSETSSAIKSRGYYSDPGKSENASDVVEYQLSSYGNRAVGWGKTATNSLIPDRDRKYIGGQFVWTGFDYIGEPTPYSAKPKSSYFGIVDTAGFPKDDYYLYQSQWLDVEESPMVHILPHWNWEDESLLNKVLVDGKVPVRVYSNASSVELFVDGVSQGEKSFAVMRTSDGRTYQQQAEDSTQLYLEWLLEYEYVPGTTIQAVAKNALGETIATDSVTTAARAVKIEASADRQVIEADGKDLSYITVEVQDAAGSFVPTAMNPLTFQISGNGKIVGVDNGDASSWERYKDTNGVWKRTAFNGKALVIVQSTKEEGSFTLTVNGSGLTAAKETVYTRTENTADDTILGYIVPEQSTETGVMPVLPESVTAVLADGEQVEKSVIWTLPDEKDLTSPGVLKISGEVETGAEVELRLVVRGLAGIRDTTLAVLVNGSVELPQNVTAIWSDGVTEERKVTWDALESSALSQAGIVELNGTVEGTELLAHAKIRVTDEAGDINIGLASKGCTVSATYEESNGNHPAREINDGDFGNQNGWGNWANGGRISDSVTMQFEESYLIDRITVWANSMNTWQTPERIKVEYWNGEDFEEVSNQEPVSGFKGREGAGDDYQGNDITFTEVQTDKLKITFETDGFTSGNDMFKITEVQVWGKGLVLNSSAKLQKLLINGEELDGFDGDVLHYSVEIPYGSDIPQVSGEAEAYGSVFSLQAVETNGNAQLEVISEDGKNSAVYNVQFTELPPVLESVELSAVSTQIKEDDIISLNVTGMLQDGSIITGENAVVTFTVEDLDGHAVVQSGNLLAYDAGSVRVTAHMSYLGKTVDSPAQEFVIAANPAEKTVISYDAVTVTTKCGEAPEFPERVTAVYDQGLPRELAVQWDTVDEQVYSSYGEYEIQGQVAGQTLRPVARLIVRDAAVMETVTLATPRYMMPELPETITGYFTDGSRAENCPVEWESIAEEAVNQEIDTVITVNGTAQIDGGTLPATAYIRISGQITSPNYVIARNGYNLPMGLASYTNDNYIKDTGYDRADYLNDGLKSFVMASGSGKKIWSNWVETNPQRSGDWVAGIIAYEGQRVERYVDKVSVGFCIETNGQIKAPQNYYVEAYTGSLDYTLEESNGQVASWQDNPLNDSDNWTEVSYTSKPEVSAIDGNSMMQISFLPIKTNIIRVRMDARSNSCLGVNELEVYGSEKVAYSDYAMAHITINGENVLSEFDINRNYVYKCTGDERPEIAAAAGNNASVTVVPIESGTPGVRIIVVPEDGNESNIRIYTVSFGKETDLEEIAERAIKAAEAAQEAQEAAIAAKEKAETAQSNAEEAMANAQRAADAAEEAQRLVNEDKTAAEQAKTNAAIAAEAAQTAKQNAELAAEQAENAKREAETAQSKAETAQRAAEAAQEAAENAKTDAETARDQAAAAQAKAEEARDGAVDAYKAAEGAQKAAEGAKDAVMAQVNLAEAAKNAAEIAQQAAEAAQKKAEEAQQKAEDAQRKAEEILEKAQKAAAEQLEEAMKKAEAIQSKAELIVKNEIFMATRPLVIAAKSKKKKQARITWEKVDNAEGYLVQYSVKANFKGAKTTIVTNGRKNALTLKKLKRKKVYYVRVKAYKTVDNTKIYTKNSAKKKVRVK